MKKHILIFIIAFSPFFALGQTTTKLVGDVTLVVRLVSLNADDVDVSSSVSYLWLRTDSHVTIDNLTNSGEVQVNSFTTLSVNSNLNNNKIFRIMSNSSAQVGSLITGSVSSSSSASFSVERNVKYGSRGDMSSPVAAELSSTNLGSRVYRHQEAGWGRNPYSKLELSDDLVAGEGYFVYMDDGPKEYEFNGTPNTGDVTLTLTSTPITTGGTDYYGWNLLGNPYPSAMLWSKFVQENRAAFTDASGNEYLNESLQYLDAGTGNWVVHNGSIVTGYNVIPIGQGFFVQVTDGHSGTAKITDTQRVHNNNGVNFAKTSPPPQTTNKKMVEVNTDLPSNYFSIKATYKENENVAHYRWREDATSGFDNRFDANKLMGLNGYNTNVYFFIGDQAASIQQEPQTEDVEVGFYMYGESGEVELSIDKYSSFSSIVLEDRVDNKEVDLLQGPYRFSYEAGDDKTAKGRFVLHLNKGTLSDDVNKIDKTNIYTNNKNIHISTPDAVLKSINVYDYTGRLVLAKEFTSKQNEHNIETDLAQGVYIVKVLTSNGTTSKTVMLN